MTEGIESLGRIRAKGLMLLAVTFAVGALAGIAAERVLASRRAPELDFPPRTDRPETRDMTAGPLPFFLRHLDLSEEQREEIEAILERWKPRTDSLMGQMVPRLRATRDSVETEIRAVLTPEQLVELDQALAERRSRSRRGRGRFGDRPPPPNRPRPPDR